MKNTLFILIVLLIMQGCNYEFQEIEALDDNIFDDPNQDFIHLINEPTYNPNTGLISFGYRTDYETFNEYHQDQIYRSIVVVNGTIRYRLEPQQGHIPMYVDPNQTGQTYVFQIAFETRERKRTIFYESFEINT